MLFGCVHHTSNVDEGKNGVVALGSSYNDVKPNKTNSDMELLYFEIFPNNFESFSELFGYRTSKSGEPTLGRLYENSEKHINFLFSMNISKRILIEKTIAISIGGRWQADGVNYFQHNLHSLLHDHTTTFIDELARHSDEEIISFWIFCFDGYNPSTKIPEALDEKIKENSRVYALMKEGFTKCSKLVPLE